MPLQNRVDPFGDLIATPARGNFMGNRGGRIHTNEQMLTSRRWASRQWICCVLDFKGRQRDVWGRYYTELFFLDEPTALAAGHRPCFECRRKDAEHFAALFAGKGRRRSAPAMDEVLHAERLDGKAKRLHRMPFSELPTAHSSQSTASLMPYAARACCAGRPSATIERSAGGAAPPMSSPRRRSFVCCRVVTSHAGIQARTRPLPPAMKAALAGRGAPTGM